MLLDEASFACDDLPLTSKQSDGGCCHTLFYTAYRFDVGEFAPWTLSSSLLCLSALICSVRSLL